MVFAAAGPVIEDKYCDPTNIPWSIDLNEARDFFKSSSLYLINDFIAQGFSSLSSLGENAETIKLVVNNDTSKTGGTISIIGPGTGLGKAILVKDSSNKKIIGIPSEGGHSPFPVCNKEEFLFYEFALEKLKHSELKHSHLKHSELSYEISFVVIA